jgi:hypothetical protein
VKQQMENVMPGNKKPNRKPGVKKINRSVKSNPAGLDPELHVQHEPAMAKTYGAQKSSGVINTPPKTGGSQRSR